MYKNINRNVSASCYHKHMFRIMISDMKKLLRIVMADDTATVGNPDDVNAFGPPSNPAAGPTPAANPIVSGMTFCS